MAEQRASGGVQAARLLIAVVGLLLGAVLLLAEQWLPGAMMLLGGIGAVVAFRRGTWDREVATEYVKPRLVGAAIGLGLFVVAAAVLVVLD